MFAQQIAQLEDTGQNIGSYSDDPGRRGPNDLEEQIRVLKFRNESLHKHSEMMAEELNKLRLEVKRLQKEVAYYAKGKIEF